jgi:hypothetical protein
MTASIGSAQEPKQAILEAERKAEIDAANARKRMAAQKPVKRAQEAVDINEAALAELEGSLKQQFQSLLKGELLFIRTVCQPTKQQYEQIVAAGDQALADAAKKSAQMQLVMHNRVRNRPIANADPRKLIADTLQDSLRTALSAEQVDQYEQELEKRSAYRKRVGLLTLIAKLDQDLLLTAEQRDQLSASLSQNWNDAWLNALGMLPHGPFFPNLPDNLVLPVLSVKQRAVWSEIPKNAQFVGMWGGFDLGAMIDAGDWGDAADAVPPDDRPEVQR